MGDNVFADCISLTDVTIGKGITTIPYKAFYYSYYLSNLIVEKNVTNIGDVAFQGTQYSSSFKCYFKGDAPTLGGANVFDSSSATIYRYSIRSGWSSTLGGRPVVTIGPSHQGLQTFGFPNISSGKTSVKKQNLGGGRLIAKASDIPLSKLQLWLKGNIGVVYDENNLVRAWNDQSGNNRNFTKSIANTGYPVYAGNSVLFTAEPSIEDPNGSYDDPNASILALPSSSLNFTTPYTLIAVARVGTTGTIFSKSTNSPKRRKYQIAIGGGGIIYSQESTGTNIDGHIIYDTGTGDDVSIKRLIVSQYSSNTFGLLRYNGNEVVTSSVNVGIDQTNNASVFIGASPFNEGIGYNAEASIQMYVYEIIFYDRALSTIEIQKIETYLNKKYLIY
jgi:hypothetical protein